MLSVSSLKSLKDVLIDQELLTSDQLNVALEEQRRHPKILGEILLDLKLIDPSVLQNALSLVTGLPVVDLRYIVTDQKVLNLLPLEIWKECRSVAFGWRENALCIAMADPENILLVDRLRQYLYESHEIIQIQLYHADSQQIESYVNQGNEFSFSQLVSEKIDDSAIELVDSILAHAVKTGASDIHFQPEKQLVRIRYRLDGILKTLQTLHKTTWPTLCVRLKVMGGMDISESRRPQNGRFTRQILGHEVDFRISSHPTIHGENIVTRLLDKDKSLLSLDDLGFVPDQIEYLKKASELPQGMIIVSGPTGSGKTTTLYALFSQMNSEIRNIMTLEEPVEYQLPGIRQTEIKDGGAVSFSDGVRSILRQDPDVIFIGEIRDEATAKMALRSTMTGHLVIATLHTSDSFGVPSRLIDLGLHPNLLAGHIICSVSQRLVRTVCISCKGSGCTKCDQSGLKGRIVLSEILTFNEDIDEIVAKGGNRTELKQYAYRHNCKTIRDDAKNKLEAGVINEAEIKRVLG